MVTQDWMAQARAWLAQLNAFLPSIVAALVLVAIGWFVARLMRGLGRRLVDGVLARLEGRELVSSALDHTGARSGLPRFIGTLLFWVVWLFFIAAAAETLGLPVVTTSLNRFAYYLPNVLAAVVIVFIGLVAGSVLGRMVRTAADSAGLARAPLLGGVAQTATGIVAIIVGLEQVGVDGDVLIVIASVVIGTTLAAVGLAFGLGARVVVENLVAAHYVGRSYQPGQLVRVGDVQGRIAGIAPTAVLVDTTAGRVSLPASRFIGEPSVLLTDPSAGPSDAGGTG